MDQAPQTVYFYVCVILVILISSSSEWHESRSEAKLTFSSWYDSRMPSLMPSKSRMPKINACAKCLEFTMWSTFETGQVQASHDACTCMTSTLEQTKTP